MKRFVGLVVLCAFALVLALLAGELVLRLAFPSLSGDEVYIWPPHLRKVFHPSPLVMPGITGPSRFSINSIGLRGDEPDPAATYRILALGGSATECLYLDQDEAWPALLQQDLNQRLSIQRVWVGNGGMSGRTSEHHLVALEYLPLDKLQIDAVVVMVGINDLATRLARDTDYDPNSLGKPDAQEWLRIQTFSGSYLPRPGDSFIKNTALWRLLRKVLDMLPREDAQDKFATMFVHLRERRQHASAIREELPDLSSALDAYASTLNRMVDMANERSVRLILVTQPTLWRSDLPADLTALLWSGAIGSPQTGVDGPYYSVGALARAMQAYNATLLQVCQQRQIECVDLASMLAKDTTVFYDDVHFNESGARQVADILAGYLESTFPQGD